MACDCNGVMVNGFVNQGHWFDPFRLLDQTQPRILSLQPKTNSIIKFKLKVEQV